MKKLTAVILTVVLAAAGGGLFHALDVPAGWLTGAMIAVAAGRYGSRPAAYAGSRSQWSACSAGHVDGRRSYTGHTAPGGVAPQHPGAGGGLGRGEHRRVLFLVRADPRMGQGLPHGSLRSRGHFRRCWPWRSETSADLPRVALAQSLRLVTLVAVMPPLLRWLAVPSTGTTTFIGTPGNLSGFLLLLGASAATAGLMYRMRFPGGVLLGAMMASAVLHGTGMIQGLSASRSARRRIHRNRRRDRKQVPRCETLGAAGDIGPSLESVVLALVISGMCAGIASALLDLPMGQIWLYLHTRRDRSNVHRCVCPGLRCRFCRDAPCRPLCRSGPDRPMVAERDGACQRPAPGNQSATDNEVSARIGP